MHSGNPGAGRIERITHQCPDSHDDLRYGGEAVGILTQIPYSHIGRRANGI